jgi:hypothetical protein
VCEALWYRGIAPGRSVLGQMIPFEIILFGGMKYQRRMSSDSKIPSKGLKTNMIYKSTFNLIPLSSFSTLEEVMVDT